MKMDKNKILAFAMALLIVLPLTSAMFQTVKATDADINDLPVQVDPKYRGVWYKFETPLVTLLFPASGRKPMFIWWYTDEPSEVYIVKFKGVIEYLTFDRPYYVRRFVASDLTIRERIMEHFVEPKISYYQNRERIREMIMDKFAMFIAKLLDLHPPYLPFSGCLWRLDGPKLVETESATYWSFNFTLISTPMPRFDFAEGNIQIRCRFYNTTTIEIPDEDYPEYNYTVAAGQLKFDFVVSNWEWNIDKLKPFFEWLQDTYEIEIPAHKTGLALWINMASIKIENLTSAENEVQYQAENQVEEASQMRGALIDDHYYPVEKNETAAGQEERPIQLKERFRKRVRIHFARGEGTMAGFLEFVPWARLLNETGDTVGFVNVTASYIAAGRHLRLFICYPYFGNYTLEHDPTIGLTSAPQIPTLVTPELIGVLLVVTVVVTIAILAYKRRKEMINIISP